MGRSQPGYRLDDEYLAQSHCTAFPSFLSLNSGDTVPRPGRLPAPPRPPLLPERRGATGCILLLFHTRTDTAVIVTYM